MKVSTKPPQNAGREPVRENLKVCEVCGQIFDMDHMGQAHYHRHEDGGEDPLEPDTREGRRE